MDTCLGYLWLIDMILNPNWKLRKLNRNTPWTQHFAMAWDSLEFFSKHTWEETINQG